MAPNSFQNDNDLKKIQGRYSPVSILLITILGIALAEILAMVVVYFFRDLPYPEQVLLDAVVMTVIIFPILYFLSFSPLLRHIDERWHAEKMVQEMALFPKLNPDGVLQVDATGRVVKCNPAAEQMGFSVDAQLFELVPDLRDLNLSECIASGTTLQVYETRMAERVLQWKIRGATDLGFAFLYSQDITERKQGEEAIKLLSSIVEQTADTVVVTNREGIIEYVNPALERVTGYTKEEVLGNTPRVIKSGNHGEQFYRGLWDTILKGEVFHGEITNRKKDGELIHETKTITPLRDAQGNITHFVATGKDITERREAEEKLRRAHDDLERRVQERTEELVAANDELTEEIRERERVEAQLTAAMSRLEAHIDNSPLAVIEFDPEFRVIRWSAEAERMFGWTAEEVVGHSIAELDWVYAEDVESVLRVSEEMLSGKSPRNVNINRNYRKDKNIIHCEWYNSAIYNAEGQLTSIQAQVLDITERKRAEEQIAKSNQKLNEILESIQDDFYVLDQNWNFVFASKLFTSKIGKEPQDFVGHNIWEMFPKHKGTILEESFRTAMEKREVQRFELGGKYTSAWYRMTVFPSAEGITVIGTDITERKRVDEALRESEEKFRSAFANAAIGFAMTAPDGHFLDANPAYCALTGYKLDELLTLGFPSIIHPDDHVENMRLIAQMLDGQIADFVVENRYRQKSGESVWVRKSVSLVRSATGLPQWIIALVEDITKRKQMEDQLRLSEMELKNAQEIARIGNWKWDIEKGEITWSDEMYRIFGIDKDSYTGRLGDVISKVVHPDDLHVVLPSNAQSLAENKPFEYRIILPDKSIRHIWARSGEALVDDKGKPIVLTGIAQDITERKKAEEELYKLNHTLKAISTSNQAMVRAHSEAELLNEVCKIVVDVCGYAMVWIGYAEDDEEKTVRPVASAGFEEGYLETLHITWADTERGRGPTGTAIRTGTSRSCRNMLTDPLFAPWREQAIQRGYASSIVLPLLIPEKTLGALTIYSRKPDDFSPDEENLLLELVHDLAYGIEMLRLRKAHELTTTALRESEERFRLALTHAPVTVAVQDHDLRYTWVYNQRTRSLDEIIGKTDVDLFPSDAEHLTALKHRVLETGENASEQLWINSNKNRLFLDLFIEPLRNEAGEIDGVGLASVDLTAIKLAEEALRHSEEQFFKIFHLSPVGGNMFRIADGCSVDVNDAFLELTGYSREEFIGHSGLELNLFPNAEERVEWMRGLREQGAVRNVDTQIRRKSGQIVDVLFSLVQIEVNGEMMGLVMTVDITERRRAEEALRRAHDELELRVQERTKELAAANRELSDEIAERKEVERQLRVETTALEAAANGVIITDIVGRILWSNPAFLNMSGYNMDEVIGATPHILFSGRQERIYYQDLWDTILEGSIWRGETINRRKDGSLYIEEQTITPVLSENEQISHFIAIKQDITERKRIEAEIQERNRHEKRLTQLIHTMQVDIARDLHDTIGQNIGYLRMKLDFMAEKDVAAQGRDLKEEFRQMSQVANESYDLVRGTLAILQSQGSDDLLQLFKRYASQVVERSALEIEFTSRGEVGVLSTHQMRQLFYIFREALSNIEKHASATHADVDMIWEADTMELSIRDNGKGFDASLATASTGHFGLRFMRERAEMVNGSFQLTTGLGAGTQIIIMVPIQRNGIENQEKITFYGKDTDQKEL